MATIIYIRDSRGKRVAGLQPYRRRADNLNIVP